MPTSRSIQTSFSAGEFDPLLWSREDVSFFYNSARIIENAIPLPQGGVKRREGWSFRALQRGPIAARSFSSVTYPNGQNVSGGVTTTGTGAGIANITRADPAAVTTSPAHGLSTGGRVAISGVTGLHARSGGTAAITNITQADPGVITAAGHGLSTGDMVEVTSVAGMTILNNSVFIATVIDQDTFSINRDTSADTSYSSGGQIEKVTASGINGPHVVTVTGATGFTLDGFDSSSMTAFISVPGGRVTRGIGNATSYVAWQGETAPGTERAASVDVTGLHIANLDASVEAVDVVLEYLNTDVSPNWQLAATLSVGSAPYNRRFAAPPDRVLGDALIWRIRVDNPLAVDLGPALVGWRDITWNVETGYSAGGTVGRSSVHRLTSSIDDEFILVMTAGNVDIFKGDTGEFVASAIVPHDDAQAADVKATPNLDTLIIYHQDVPPYIIQRLGSDRDWRSNALAFDSVAEFPFGDGNVSGGKNEIQFLRFADMSVGDKVLFEFNGEASPDVVMTGNPATNAANFADAIKSLTDISDVSVTIEAGSTVNANFLVEFQGIDGKKAWPILVVDITSGSSGTVTLSRKQFGKPDTAPLWGASRGYPRCGAFYQGRHWMGGFKARPDLVVGSRAGSLFDFKEDADPIPSSPIVVAPNVDDQITIQNIYPGRHLQVFTSSSEMYVPEEPITIDNIALKVTSRLGSGGRCTPVSVQGGTLFVDRNGIAIREYLFADAEQSYTSEPVSLLAGHLVAQPRSLVMRRASSTYDPAQLLVANTGTASDGSSVPAAIVVIDRAQQITAFCRIATPGVPLEFAATQGGSAFALVRRSLAGPEWNFLEQFDSESMSDCSVRLSGSGSTVDLSQYPWMEGQKAYAHVDGLPAGEFTVTGNTVDLGDYSYSSEVEIGLRQVPRIVMHPFKGRGDISPTMQNMRIFRALLQLERTAAIAITAQAGGTPRPVSLQNYDSGVMDPTLDELLFTGAKRVSGLGAWQKEPVIELTQLAPMPFTVRSATFDVRY